MSARKQKVDDPPSGGSKRRKFSVEMTRKFFEEGAKPVGGQLQIKDFTISKEALKKALGIIQERKRAEKQQSLENEMSESTDRITPPLSNEPSSPSDEERVLVTSVPLPIEETSSGAQPPESPVSQIAGEENNRLVFERLEDEDAVVLDESRVQTDENETRETTDRVTPPLTNDPSPSEDGGISVTTLPPPPPPIEESSNAPPPIAESSSAPPPIAESSSAPPPIAESSSAPPPIAEGSSAPPPIAESSSAPPPIEESSSAPPPESPVTQIPHEESNRLVSEGQEEDTVVAVTGGLQTDENETSETTDRIPPPGDGNEPSPTDEQGIPVTTFPPPPIEESSIAPPPIEESSIAPPPIEESSSAPPIEQSSSAPPPETSDSQIADEDNNRLVIEEPAEEDTVVPDASRVQTDETETDEEMPPITIRTDIFGDDDDTDTADAGIVEVTNTVGPTVSTVQPEAVPQISIIESALMRAAVPVGESTRGDLANNLPPPITYTIGNNSQVFVLPTRSEASNVPPDSRASHPSNPTGIFQSPPSAPPSVTGRVAPIQNDLNRDLSNIVDLALKQAEAEAEFLKNLKASCDKPDADTDKIYAAIIAVNSKRFKSFESLDASKIALKMKYPCLPTEPDARRCAIRDAELTVEEVADYFEVMIEATLLSKRPNITEKMRGVLVVIITRVVRLLAYFMCENRSVQETEALFQNINALIMTNQHLLKKYQQSNLSFHLTSFWGCIRGSTRGSSYKQGALLDHANMGPRKFMERIEKFKTSYERSVALSRQAANPQAATSVTGGSTEQPAVMQIRRQLYEEQQQQQQRQASMRQMQQQALGIPPQAARTSPQATIVFQHAPGMHTQAAGIPPQATGMPQQSTILPQQATRMTPQAAINPQQTNRIFQQATRVFQQAPRTTQQVPRMTQQVTRMPQQARPQTSFLSTPSSQNQLQQQTYNSISGQTQSRVPQQGLAPASMGQLRTHLVQRQQQHQQQTNLQQMQQQQQQQPSNLQQQQQRQQQLQPQSNLQQQQQRQQQLQQQSNLQQQQQLQQQLQQQQLQQQQLQQQQLQQQQLQQQPYIQQRQQQTNTQQQYSLAQQQANAIQQQASRQRAQFPPGYSLPQVGGGYNTSPPPPPPGHHHS